MRRPNKDELEFIAYGLLSEGYGGGPFPLSPMPEGWEPPEDLLFDPETGWVAMDSQAYLVVEAAE